MIIKIMFKFRRICDTRCLGAVSDECLCQCEGVNHGKLKNDKSNNDAQNRDDVIGVGNSKSDISINAPEKVE